MNYIGDHPFNLLGKVAIVTSAASPTGAAICRELLNCNANVLGVDAVPAHKTTNSNKGSHFQFFRYFEDTLLNGKEVVEFAKGVYLRDNIDFLIDVLGERNIGKRVLSEVVEVMQGQGRGLVLSVLTGDRKEEKPVITTVKDLLSQLEGTSVRCNVVLPHVSNSGDVSNGDAAIDPRTRIVLHDHIAVHVERRDKGGYPVEPERDIANLILLLCTRLGDRLSGLVIGTNGNSIAL